MKHVDSNELMGERLRALRESTGLSQEAFGKLGGVTKSTQYLYERSERQPDAAYFAAIRRTVGADLNLLIGGSSESPAARNSKWTIDQVMAAFASIESLSQDDGRMSMRDRRKIFERLLLMAVGAV